jgi:hypothetical protein
MQRLSEQGKQEEKAGEKTRRPKMRKQSWEENRERLWETSHARTSFGLVVA